MLNIRIK